MGSSSVFRCNCVDRFMCIVLCEREDVRVLRHACHHVLMSPLFCLGQKLVALRVLDVSLWFLGRVCDDCKNSEETSTFKPTNSYQDKIRAMEYLRSIGKAVKG